MANPPALRRIVTERRVVQQADLQAEEPDAPLAKVCRCPHASGSALAQAARACRGLKCVTQSEPYQKRGVGGLEIGFGIGIAHGFATLGTIGYEGRFDFAAIGTVSNVASRLCDEAKPGQILISRRVLTKVENAVRQEKVQQGVSYRLDGVEILAVQVEIVEGRQSDQSCRHTAVHADIEATIV